MIKFIKVLSDEGPDNVQSSGYGEQEKVVRGK